MDKVTFIHARSESADDYYFSTEGELSFQEAEEYLDEQMRGTSDEGYVWVHHVMVHG